MDDDDQIVYDPLEVVQYTKRDLGKAVALLTNSLVIDIDECRRLAEKIARMWPARAPGAIAACRRGAPTEPRRPARVDAARRV